MKNSAEKPPTVLQFGREVPLSMDGTHVTPQPLEYDLNSFPTFSDESEGDVLPQVYAVTTPLLAQGRSHKGLAGTDRFEIVIKCYASGGENYLHAHTEEDHSFVVLSGEATFHGPKGKIASLGRNQGILIPRGAYYSFQSSGNTPLVLLRFGVPYPGNRVIALEGNDRAVDTRDHKFPAAVLLGDKVYS